MDPTVSTGRPFQAILCPVDFSAHSRLALKYAEAIVRRSRTNGARLTVLSVNDPLLMAAAAAAYPGTDGLTEQTFAELRQFVKTSVSPTTMKSSSVRCTVAVGVPAQEIVSTATKRKADLIVIATRGLGGVRKLLVGSTTDRVLADATVPVLAIPPVSGNRPDSVPPGWPGRRILLALDLRDDSEIDAAAGAAVAERLGAKLVLVHVVPPIQHPPWVGGRFARIERTRVAVAQSQLEAVAASLGTGARARCLVRVGNPAHEVVALAAKLGVGLVIVTHRRGQRMLRWRLGRVAYEIVRHAVVPVLSLPIRRR